jgi:hypothetical protein
MPKAARLLLIVASRLRLRPRPRLINPVRRRGRNATPISPVLERWKDESMNSLALRPLLHHTACASRVDMFIYCFTKDRGYRRRKNEPLHLAHSPLTSLTLLLFLLLLPFLLSASDHIQFESQLLPSDSRHPAPLVPASCRRQFGTSAPLQIFVQLIFEFSSFFFFLFPSSSSSSRLCSSGRLSAFYCSQSCSRRFPCTCDSSCFTMLLSTLTVVAFGASTAFATPLGSSPGNKVDVSSSDGSLPELNSRDKIDDVLTELPKARVPALVVLVSC